MATFCYFCINLLLLPCAVSSHCGYMLGPFIAILSNSYAALVNHDHLPSNYVDHYLQLKLNINLSIYQPVHWRTDLSSPDSLTFYLLDTVHGQRLRLILRWSIFPWRWPPRIIDLATQGESLGILVRSNTLADNNWDQSVGSIWYVRIDRGVVSVVIFINR